MWDSLSHWIGRGQQRLPTGMSGGLGAAIGVLLVTTPMEQWMPLLQKFTLVIFDYTNWMVGAALRCATRGDNKEEWYG